MCKYKVLLLLICLICSSNSFLAKSIEAVDSDGLDNTMVFLNKLFELQNLPKSIQLGKCLNDPKEAQLFANLI